MNANIRSTLPLGANVAIFWLNCSFPVNKKGDVPSIRILETIKSLTEFWIVLRTLQMHSNIQYALSNVLSGTIEQQNKRYDVVKNQALVPALEANDV